MALQSQVGGTLSANTLATSVSTPTIIPTNQNQKINTKIIQYFILKIRHCERVEKGSSEFTEYSYLTSSWKKVPNYAER